MQTKPHQHSFNKKPDGVTLAEILICIAIFSVAVVSIYMANQSSQRAIANSMRNDVEAAVANMKIAEVNPYDIDVDTVYDLPATYTTGKQSYNLPSGQIIYWTRAVTSNKASGDVKQVSVYLFKRASDTTPYRKFRKDLVLERQSYMLADSGASGLARIYKDAVGNVWSRLDNNVWANMGTGDTHRAGPNAAVNATAPDPVDVTTATVVPDTTMWTYGHTTNNASPTKLAYVVPATDGVSYTIKLGFCECNGGTAGQRNVKVNINGSNQESSLDIFTLAGANRAVVRQYTAIPIDLGSGVFGIQIEIDRNGSTLKPQLLNFQVERDTIQ